MNDSFSWLYENNKRIQRFYCLVAETVKTVINPLNKEQ